MLSQLRGSPWRHIPCLRQQPAAQYRGHVEQGLKMATVTGFAAGQIESEWETVQVRLDRNFG